LKNPFEKTETKEDLILFKKTKSIHSFFKPKFSKLPILPGQHLRDLPAGAEPPTPLNVLTSKPLLIYSLVTSSPSTVSNMPSTQEGRGLLAFFANKTQAGSLPRHFSNSILSPCSFSEAQSKRILK
jgi:hypothetical protein